MERGHEDATGAPVPVPSPRPVQQQGAVPKQLHTWAPDRPQFIGGIVDDAIARYDAERRRRSGADG